MVAMVCVWLPCCLLRPDARSGGAPRGPEAARQTELKEREANIKDRERKNEALNEKNEKLNDKALNDENKKLGVPLGEAQDAGNALLVTRLNKTIERNHKAIEDNRKAIQDNHQLVKPVVQVHRAFYGLVKDCVLQLIPWKGEDDPRVRVATLPEGQLWLTLKSRVLFVRSCYDALWNELDQFYKASQVPGVVKRANTGRSPQRKDTLLNKAFT